MSQASASSQPPPSANPLIAATVGFGIVSSRWPHRWPSSPQRRRVEDVEGLHVLDVRPSDEGFLARAREDDDAASSPRRALEAVAQLARARGRGA